MKEVMGKWEERNSEDKEERLKFGTAEGREIRLLGNWVGSEQDIRNRIWRAEGVWGRVKDGLKGSRSSKKWQARKVEGTVVSSLLYDCQARVWWDRDIERLQSWVDRCYRYRMECDAVSDEPGEAPGMLSPGLGPRKGTFFM